MRRHMRQKREEEDQGTIGAALEKQQGSTVPVFILSRCAIVHPGEMEKVPATG